MDLKNKLNEMNELTNFFSKMSPEDFSKSIKSKSVIMFMNERFEHPSMTKKDICKRIGVSLPVLNKNLKDLSYDNFIKKRNKKPKSEEPIPKIKHPKNLKGGANNENETQILLTKSVDNIINNAYQTKK